MTALDAQDFAILGLALNLLQRYADGELAKARRQSNDAKRAAMIAMRLQIGRVRSKLRAMRTS